MNEKVKPDTVAVVVNMNPELKATLKKLALMHGMSLSRLFRAVLTHYAEENREKLERYDALVSESTLDA
jgi:hypothetical protein